MKDNSEQKELVANVKWVEGWETFTLLPTPRSYEAKPITAVRYGDFFALQACNGMQVRYALNGGRELAAVTVNFKEWETLAFVKPSDPK